MATQNESGFKTFQATAVALEAFVRVTADANGLISAAGETDLGIGVVQEAVAASGYGTVKLWTAPGTFQIQAAAAVTRGARLYTKAAGEIDDSGTYYLRLVALEAATAQGDIIECAVIQDAVYNSGSYASSDVGTIAAAGSAQGNATAISAVVTYVTASNGAKGVILPAVSAGAVLEVYNTVASQGLLIYPASGDDINDGTSNAAITIAGKSHARFVGLDSDTWAASYTAA